MSAGAQVAIQVVKGLVESAPAVGELLASIAGTSREELSARLDRAEASIQDPIDPSTDDAARAARLEGILRGERPIGERETPAAPANPYGEVARAVVGCVDCGKPAALVGDLIPADGLCRWCRDPEGTAE